MHLKRLLIAVILLPLLYLYVTRLPAVYFLFLLVVATVLAQYEFYSMYNIKGSLRFAGIASGVLIISIAYFSRNLLIDLLFLSFIVIACIRLFSKRDPSFSLHDIATVAAAVLYVPGLLGYQVYLREQDAEWIIFLYGCVWASDSMAYYVGSSMGKRKLYKEVSPNKTVAGAVGSISGGVIGVIIIRFAFVHSIYLPLVKSLILGMIIGAVSIVGDLVESMFKRDAKIKDSSNIVPGHGGMLDKLDSALFAGPVLYWVAGAFGLMK